MSRWLIACGGLGFVVAALAAASLFHAAPAVRGESGLAQNKAIADQPKPPFAALGAGSCAAAACHGGPANASLAGKYDPRTWTGSATHFHATDPHRKAFEALQMPLAADIMKHLNLSMSATEDARCVACHTNPALAASKNPHEVALRQEGVSCEACHGNAQGWLREHTTWTDANRAAGYEQSSMTKLFDLGERAVACVGCHVGAPADPARGYPVRDMNHDMIAAGHPRLNFDFATYQHSLPKHWREKDTSPEFEFKAWLAGRGVHFVAAAELLTDRKARAQRHDPRTPWPEFAEFNCVSCHHRLEAAFPDSQGAPTWQTIFPLSHSQKKLPSEEALNNFIERPGEVRGKDPVIDNAMLKKLEPMFFEVAERRVRFVDRDEAVQIYHGLAAHERMQMKREGRPRFDPAFDRLAVSLHSERGNINFTVNDKIRDDLKYLLAKTQGR